MKLNLFPKGFLKNKYMLNDQSESERKTISVAERNSRKELSKVWGDPEGMTQAQSEILLEKKLLLNWYRKIYQYMADNLSNETVHVEIGSGSSMLHEYINGLIRSNVIFIKKNDLIFSAFEMPFMNASIGNIILIDVLHHLKDPYAFFKEAQRVLKPGGRVLLCDPYLSILSYPVWKYLHPESCDRSQVGFNKDGGINPLIDANSASATLLFCSGKERLSQYCKNLSVVKVDIHSKFQYWLAGGYNFPQFLPTVFTPLVNWIEQLLSPFDRWLASFLFAVIEKKR